jgi:hypothetical protein
MPQGTADHRPAAPRRARPSFGIAMLALGLLAACSLTLPAQAGALITDGNFEATSLASPGGFLCQNGSMVGSTCTSNLTDWSATCSASGCEGTSTPGSLLFAGTNGDADVQAFNGGYGLYPTVLNPPGGGNVVAIDGGSPYSSSIFQTVSGLIVGQEYILNFYQGAAQQSGVTGNTTEKWQVTFGSNTQSSNVMSNVSGGVVGWQRQFMNFIATSTSETLTFLAVGTPNGDPPVVLLADVGMSLPEPGSLAMIGTGVLVILAARRRARA